MKAMANETRRPGSEQDWCIETDLAHFSGVDIEILRSQCKIIHFDTCMAEYGACSLPVLSCSHILISQRQQITIMTFCMILTSNLELCDQSLYVTVISTLCSFSVVDDLRYRNSIAHPSWRHSSQVMRMNGGRARSFS